MVYELQSNRLIIRYSPSPCAFSVTVKDTGSVWRWAAAPSFAAADGAVFSFDEASCEAAPYRTGVADGVRAVYSDFRRKEDGRDGGVRIFTYIALDSSGFLRCEARIEEQNEKSVSELRFPAAFSLDASDGYTLIPRMQGAMFPAGTDFKHNGTIYERDSYMPIFAQLRGTDGYLGILETPYDARYDFENDRYQPIFIPSLGYLTQKRVVLYDFMTPCTVNTIAAHYRAYLASRGELTTLREKIARNPRVAKLIGCPIVHTGSAVHISPQSDYYKPDDPANNDSVIPFDDTAALLRKLKANGVEEAYLHLDGWGNHGYDNLHPDVFPPNPSAGGAPGMRRLQQTCTALSYLFGIHDQYRDYYYDAASFSFDNAVQNQDGSHPYCSIWFGGPHSWLCSQLAPDYVRRNYDRFEELDIRLDGSYLDVFSVVFLDECFNPDHPATRRDCAEKRRECLDILTARGIIPSSEEVLGCIIESQVLCHHAPFFTSDLGSDHSANVGIPVPLLNLVYHDCIVIPWFGIDHKGGWGIAGTDWGFLWALLCGDPVYYSLEETPANIARGKMALELNKRVAFCTFTHEWIEGDVNRRRSVFSDGTIVEADFSACSFVIRYPDGKVVSGALDEAK